MLRINHKIKMTTLVVFGALSLGFTQLTYAQTYVVQSYEIPSGPLSHAIQRLARETGVIVSFDAATLKGLTTNGLNGQYSFESGLTQLLRGNHLSWSRVDGVYTIKKTNRSVLTESSQGIVSQDDAQLEDVIVIGNLTKKNSTFREASSSVYLSEKDLGRFARVSPSDILNGIAGVETGDSRNGGALDVNIRGIQGMGRVAVTVDGSQQALETYRGYGGTQNRSYISPDLISSVTVEKGASTQAGGSGAIGGVVAMQTIGVKDVVKAGQQTGIRITGNVWSNSTKPNMRSIGEESSMTSVGKMPGGLNNLTGRSGSIAVGHKGDQIDFVAAYARQRQGNFYAGKRGVDRYPNLNWVYRANEEVMNTSSQNETVLLKTTMRPTEQQVIDLSYQYFDGEFGEIMGSALYRGNGDRIPQWPIGKMRINTYRAGYKYMSPDHTLLDLKANLWLTQAKNQQLNAGPVAPSSQESIIDTDYRWSKLNNKRWGLDFSNDAVFNTQLGPLTWTLGGSYLAEDIRPNKVDITQDDRNNNLHLRDAQRQEMSLLSRLQYKPTDKLTLEVGGRYTKFKNRDRNQIAHRFNIYSDNPYKNVWLSVKTEHGYTRIGTVPWYASEEGEYLADNHPGEKLMSGQGKDLLITAYGGPYTLEEFEHKFKGKVIGYDVEREEKKGEFLGYRYEYEEPKIYSGDEFAPFASIRYQVVPYGHIYANYKEGIRVPGLFETTTGMGAGVSSISPDLRPERSKAWEFGAAAYQRNLFRFDDEVNIKLAYFKTDIKDFIARYFTDTLEMHNSESFKVSGMELQLNYDTGTFFADLSATKYIKAQTCDKKVAAFLRQYEKYVPDCTDGGFRGSYVNTQNPPKTTFVLTAGIRALNEKLTLGSRITKTSGPLHNLNNIWQAQTTTIQVKYEPVTVVDLFASYDVNDSVSFNFSIDNLTNRYYFDPLAQSLMPAPGRNYRLGFSYKF